MSNPSIGKQSGEVESILSLMKRLLQDAEVHSGAHALHSPHLWSDGSDQHRRHHCPVCCCQPKGAFTESQRGMTGLFLSRIEGHKAS